MQLIGRLRAIGTSSLLWSGAWAVVYAAATALEIAISTPSDVAANSLAQFVPRAAVSGAAWGLVAGATFAVVFGRMQRGRTLMRLSRAKAAAWGAVAGAVVPGIELANQLARAPGPITFRWGAAALLPALAALSAAAAVYVAQRTGDLAGRPNRNIDEPDEHPELGSPEGAMSDIPMQVRNHDSLGRAL